MDTSKIIKGVVNSGRYTVTAPIVKEDYGLYLQIEGVELPSTYEVDFSNSEHNGTSVTMIGNSDGVLIPHQFIDTGKDIFAFLYHVGENFGRTVYKFRIPNKVRPDRTNEEPTPEEQSTIDQAISALNEAVAQTAQDVINAGQSAQSAQGYAEQAETARDTAQGYASNAQLSATQASNSAISANQSASASAQSASEAQSASTNAETYALNSGNKAVESAQSAQASANSATQAQGYANDASASAQSASGYASQAQESEQTASTKSSEASQSATTASTKASEASTSASQALTYKTDAESAKTASQTAQGLAESARDSAITAKTDAESAKDDAETARDEAQTIVDGISGALNDKAPVITDTASGSIASFTDGADGLPLKSLVVNIDPVQDTSSGDPSPENICPISGWTQVNVNHSDADMTNPTTITIDLGQTVYGGKLDVLTGELVIDRAMVDLGSKTFIKWVNDNNTFVRAVPGISTTSQNITCNTYAPLINSGIMWGAILSYDMTIYHPLNDIYLLIRDTRYTDATAFNTSISGVQLVYPLATPITIQLTPQQVNSLLGVNNLWADSGDTEVVYRADTKLYIQKKIAEAISALS